jgi:hypothetical protein
MFQDSGRAHDPLGIDRPCRRRWSDGVAASAASAPAP